MSIDLQSQLQRLASSGLRDDTQAVLKLVQAFVAMGSQEIQIFSCNRELSVYGRNIDNRFWPVQRDASCLVDDAGTDLLFALSRLLTAKPSLVGISRWSKSKISEWTLWQGERQPQSLRRPPKSLEDGLGFHLQFDQSKNPLQLDHFQLEMRLFWAPCLVLYQGKPLGRNDCGVLKEVLNLGSDQLRMEFYPRPQPPNRGILARYSGAATTTEPSSELHWGLPLKGDPLISHSRWFGAEVTLQEKVLLESEISPFGGLERPAIRSAAAAYFRDFSSSRPSVILPIKRGVLLDPVAWDPGVSTTCAVVADEIATDLGQFQIRQDQTAALQSKAATTVITAVNHGMKNPHLWFNIQLTRRENLLGLGFAVAGSVIGWLFSGWELASAFGVGSGLVGAHVLEGRHRRLYHDHERADVVQQLRSIKQTCLALIQDQRQ